MKDPYPSSMGFFSASFAPKQSTRQS